MENERVAFSLGLKISQIVLYDPADSLSQAVKWGRNIFS